MRFRVHRASDFEEKKAPVDGAVCEDGDWFIEVPDLDALLKLRDKEGDLILYQNSTLWVYDDYME